MRSGPVTESTGSGGATLSLLPPMLNQLYRVDNVTMAVNYGLNKVRFPAPVPSGSRVRGRRGSTKRCRTAFGSTWTWP